MKTLLSRILSLILSLVLCICLLPIAWADEEIVSPVGDGVRKKLQLLQETEGFKIGQNGGQCMTFAGKVFREIFGGICGITYYGHEPDSSRNTYLVYRLCDKTVQAFKQQDSEATAKKTSYGVITQDSMKGLLQMAIPGDLIVTTFEYEREADGASTHTVVVNGVTSTGLSLYQSNYVGAEKISINTQSWYGFYTMMNWRDGTHKVKSYASVSLYRARNYSEVDGSPFIPINTSDLTISFHANGGTGIMSDISTYAGGTFTVPECSFTKPGYVCSLFNMKRSDGKWLSFDGQFVDYETAVNVSGLSYFQSGLEYTFENEWVESEDYTYTFVAYWKEESTVSTEQELRAALLSENNSIIIKKYITLSSDLTIPENKKVSIINSVLTIPAGIKLTNNGSLQLGGAYEGTNYEIENGNITVDGTLENYGSIQFIGGHIEQSGLLSNIGTISLDLVELADGNTVATVSNTGTLQNDGWLDWRNDSSGSIMAARFTNDGSFTGTIEMENSYVRGIPNEQIDAYITVVTEDDLHACVEAGYNYVNIYAYDSLELSKDLNIPASTSFYFGNWNTNIGFTIPTGIKATFESAPFCEFAPDGSYASIKVDGELYLPKQSSLGENGSLSVSGKLVLGNEDDTNDNLYNTWFSAAGQVSIQEGGELINYISVAADQLDISDKAILHNYGRIQGINTIDETVFPDWTFREYVRNYDTDNNGYFSENEISAITAIDCSSFTDISSLKGIELFSALQELNCNYNQITVLDISKNTALQKLYCYDNQLTALDVSQNAELQELFCGKNQLNTLTIGLKNRLQVLNCIENELTTLDISGCPQLAVLDCFDNQLTALDVSKSKTLQMCHCYNNKLTSVKVNDLPELRYLYCNQNELTNLIVDGCTALEELVCWSNNLDQLDVSTLTALKLLGCDSNRINSLNLANNPELQELYCFDNQLASLDVSHNANLQILSCGGNQFAGLDLRKNSKLEDFQCFNGRLTSLTIGSKPVLKRLSVDGNHLTSLDLSAADALIRLDCADNQLMSLDLSAKNALERLDCSGNLIKGLSINDCPKLIQIVKDAVPVVKDGVIQYELEVSEDYSMYFWYDDGVLLLGSTMPDLILPASLTVIEDEAFAGGAFTYVQIPDGTTSIGWHAFADCPNLAYIIIPALTTQIDEQAFGNQQGLTILGKADTVAESYAQDHNYTFIAVP